MWLVGELSIQHRRVDAGGGFGGLDTPEFRMMNPHGRIPVLDDGGTVLPCQSAMRTKFAEIGGMVLAGSPAEFGKLTGDEIQKWRKVIKFAGIKPE
jgi:glutathione S-transferase